MQPNIPDYFSASLAGSPRNPPHLALAGLSDLHSPMDSLSYSTPARLPGVSSFSFYDLTASAKNSSDTITQNPDFS